MGRVSLVPLSVGLWLVHTGLREVRSGNIYIGDVFLFACF